MCFLKNVDRTINYDLLFSKIQDNSHDITQLQPNSTNQIYQQNSNLKLPSVSLPSVSPPKQPKLDLQSMLQNLSNRINQNNMIIESIEQKLLEPKIQFKPVQVLQQKSNHKTKPQDQLLYNLFGEFDPQIGNKQFKFKLGLEHNIPKKLYKSKKFQCSVKILDCKFKNTVRKNYNPLDICVGVFDNQGKWITQNLLGEPILQGITSVQLLNGRADFNKIYLRQISGNLPNKRLNLAIYVKPGIKTAIGIKSNSNEVNWRQIKPLLLKNLTVLSKNRKNIYDDQC